MKKLKLNLTANYAMLQSSYWMSCCCVMTFATVFFLSRGFSNTEIGITMAVANGLSIFCQPFLAAFADKTQRIPLRTIVGLTMAVSSTAGLVLMFLPNLFLPVAVVYILLMAFQNMQQSLMTSLAMEHINENAPLNYSLARGMGSLTFAIVSLFMGYLINAFGSNIIMPFHIFFALICMLVGLTFPRPAKKKHQAEIPGASASGFLEFTRGNKRFMLTILCMILLLFSHSLINTYTIQIVKDVGGNEADMGIAMAIAAFIELPAMIFFPRLLKKLGSAGLILKLAAVFIVLKTAVTIYAPSVSWFFIAQSMQLIAFAVYIPASVYFVNRIVKGADKVKGQTYMGLALGISGTLGSMAGGALIDQFGVKYTLTVALVVSVIGLISFLFVAPKDKEEALPAS